jgi:tripartite-type tricarboxylate transporter receptor subunit TctC
MGNEKCRSAKLWHFSRRAYDRTISYIVPTSPGSSPDIVGRIMADALAKILGQPIVVLNRPGAGGTIVAAAAAKAALDGYTII